VVGFKPSFGFTDMSGSNILVPRLAQTGFLANSVTDVALLASGFDGRFDEPRPNAALRLAAVQGPGWDLVERDAAEAFGQWCETNRMSMQKRRIGPALGRSLDIVRGLLDAHLAERFEAESRFDLLCPPLQESVVRGRDMSASQFMQLNRGADEAALVVDELFEDADVLVTLAAPGQATVHGAPGSGALTMPWSLCGLPTLSLPLLRGRDGLPIGLQLIAQRGNDQSLTSCAASLR
jgi:Asp-tRNA(Asn)/Glu-tRNA(Gln) amidotransferase A subunit family amidase